MNIAVRRLFSSGLTWWLIGAAAGIYYLSPLFMPGAAEKPVKFGIDLVGGTYISLIVDTDKAVEDALVERIAGIKADLKEAKIMLPLSSKVEHKKLVLSFEDAEQAREAAGVIHESHGELKQKQANNTVTLYISSHEEANIRSWAVESNIRVLRNRVDKFAVSEVTIAPQGERNIIIELPDVDDPQRAKAMIGKAALLEFKLVDALGMSEEEILEGYDGELPDGMMVIPGKVKRGYESERVYYLVPHHADITGKLLRDARPEPGELGKMTVGFEFSSEGGKRFYELTSHNIGKLLAVILDGEVISAPTIQAAIKNRGQITGAFTMEQAKELADLLKSGAYVAPVKFDEERQIGPSLGAKAIKQGTFACLIGLILLLIFSVLYYRVPGFFAFSTLVYNLLLILLILSWFKGTLTLPGIASLILTLGMAVDSSILIYERIKEELRNGIPLARAIESGFSGALAVILDANITTFIMAVVLYKFGTGPVQGFAITMMIGIVTTLITGLFFLRSLFTFALRVFGVQSMKF
jgi:preprotein translocase subunit SecD